MAIRIGSSCELKKPAGKVTETRRFIGSWSNWKEVSQKCIDNKIYLILTICINRNDKSGHYPTDTEWINMVEDTCRYLKSIGMNRNNGYVSIVNEPMKFCTKEQYGHLLDIAYLIIHRYGFLVGAGNEQFTMAMVCGDMYSYILEHHRNSFDILDIHLQGDCELDELCREKADWFKFMADGYGKSLDCTEAFYGDIATDRGYGSLKNQRYHAERVGIPNFCSVFYDLWESAFPASMQKFLKGWHKLCFKINGIFRNKATEKNWYKWMKIIDEKAPVPNIPIEEEDMKLEKYYYRLKVTYNRDKTKAGIKFIQTVIEVEPDGKWGDATDNALETYQITNGLAPDKIVGPLTFREMMKTNPNSYIDLQYFLAVGDW